MSIEHVVVISNSASIKGGAEKVACQTACLLAESGIDTYIFAATGPVSPELVAADVHIRCLRQDYISASGRNKLVAALQGLWNRKVERELSKLLSTLDPATTVVNLHSWTHTMSASILAAVRKAGFPLVITAHDYFLACPNGGFYHYPENRPCSLRAVDARCKSCNCDKRSMAQHKYRLARFALQERELERIHPGVIFLSDFSYSILKASIPFNYDEYRISNPVFALERKNTRSFFGDRDIDCLFVGRVDPEKGCDLFCKAVELAGVKGVVVGDGSERKALMAAHPDVEFVGKKTPAEVDEYYRRAKALVFPSYYFEVQSLVMIEAKLAGNLPILVSNGIAAADYVDDGVDGYVFPYGDTRALADRIRLVLDPSTNCRMRAAVAAEDFSAFDPSLYAKSMISIYEDALKRRGKRKVVA